MPDLVASSRRGDAVTRAVAGTILATEGPASLREQRAAEIVAAMDVTDAGRGAWRVRSQSGDRHYRVRGNQCDCPDAAKGNACKHVLAVGLLAKFSNLLAERLGREWDGTAEGAGRLGTEYRSLLESCAAYRPPAEGLLTAYSLEALGDDQAQRWKAHARRGVAPPALLKPPSPWVARITGLCPQYEFAREFVRGHRDYRDADKCGASGVWIYYELSPGLYEIHEITRAAKYHRPGESRRFFARVANLSVAEISKAEVLRCMTAQS